MSPERLRFEAASERGRYQEIGEFDENGEISPLISSHLISFHFISFQGDITFGSGSILIGISSNAMKVRRFSGFHFVVCLLLGF